MHARRHTPEVDEIYQAVYQVETTLYSIAGLMALWIMSSYLL